MRKSVRRPSLSQVMRTPSARSARNPRAPPAGRALGRASPSPAPIVPAAQASPAAALCREGAIFSTVDQTRAIAGSDANAMIAKSHFVGSALTMRPPSAGPAMTATLVAV